MQTFNGWYLVTPLNLLKVIIISLGTATSKMHRICMASPMGVKPRREWQEFRPFSLQSFDGIAAPLVNNNGICGWSPVICLKSNFTTGRGTIEAKRRWHTLHRFGNHSPHDRSFPWQTWNGCFAKPPEQFTGIDVALNRKEKKISPDQADLNIRMKAYGRASGSKCNFINSNYFNCDRNWFAANYSQRTVMLQHIGFSDRKLQQLCQRFNHIAYSVTIWNNQILKVMEFGIKRLPAKLC